MRYGWTGNGVVGEFAFNRMNNSVVRAIAFGWININEIANGSMGIMELPIIFYIKSMIILGVAQGWRNEVEC
jgi:hypothetical protein